MKQIPGFPNYFVTKDGRVWSKPKRCHNGKWLNLQRDKDGYNYVKLTKNKKKYHKLVHSLVLETYTCSRPQGMVARHKDGNPANNWYWNLEWGTPSENTQDSMRHGTARCLKQYGEDNSTSKLTKDQVQLIFNAYHDGAYTQQELANHFNVSRSLIGLICQKKRWGHLWAA